MMKNIIVTSLGVIVALLSLSWIASSQEQKSSMTFFITSVGSGKGAVSAAWRAPISTAKRSRKQSAPATVPGVLI
jgi:hypothetical protein